MEQIKNFWKYLGQYEFLENDMQNLMICMSILILGILLKQFLSVRSSRLAYYFVKKASSDIPVSDFVALVKRPVEVFLLFVVVYIAFSYLKYPDSWNLVSGKRFGLKMFVNRGYKLLFFISFMWILFGVIDFFSLVLKKHAEENDSKVQEQLVPFLRQLVKLIIVIFVFFAILGVVFQVNVGAVVAGLGIGGIAVALAGKETLENLLASFSIFIDKPFVSGDLIKINQITGNVETVGFRTTRVRTLDNSVVTIPNKLLIDQPLENLSSRYFFRAKMELGISLNTSEEKLKSVTKEILQIIEAHPDTKEAPEVFIDTINTSSIIISIVYFIKMAAPDGVMAIKEKINYEIVKVFGKHEVSLASPASLLYLNNYNFKDLKE